MQKGHLQACLYLGDGTELVATSDRKELLVISLSSRLEQEEPGVFGYILDTHKGEIIYRCCRTSY